MEDTTLISKPPRTPAQIEASRNNGAKSKGPTSAAGKARSSQNAIDHGLAATKYIVLSNENPRCFDEFLGEYAATWRPADPVERDLVRQMAHAQFTLERLWLMESAALDLEMERMDAELKRAYTKIDPPTVQTLAFSALAKDGPTLPLLNRYQARLERTYHRALHTLLALRKARQAAQRPPAQPRRQTNPTRLSATGIQARMRVDSFHNPPIPTPKIDTL